MRKGDIVVNPWVSTYFDGELNPNYATIYLGDNKTLDYKGRVHKWADKIYKDNPQKNTPWKVIGHIDLYGIAELAIRDAVFAEEIADTPQTEETCERCVYVRGSQWCQGCNGTPKRWDGEKIVDTPQTDMDEDIVRSCGFKVESYRQAKAKDEPQTDCGWK